MNSSSTTEAAASCAGLLSSCYDGRSLCDARLASCMVFNDTNTTAALTTLATSDPDGNLLDSLLPAILQVFFIIIIGFVMGQTGLVPPSNGPHIGKLIGTVLLPAALFRSMAKLKFTESAVTFFLSVLVSKSSMFLVVAVLTIALDRSTVRFAKAGIRAVFVTQSNDFALLVPIFSALYGKTHPEYVDLIYLVAPISLVLLNPIAFVLMEYSSRYNAGLENPENAEPFSCKIILLILLKVFRNPIVLMTFLGLIYNIILGEGLGLGIGLQLGLPSIVDNTLLIFAKAFAACALFTLGLVIVGKFQLLKPGRMVIPVALINCKLIFAPIIADVVCQQLLKALNMGASDGDASLSIAVLIYSTAPTATGVFLYCSQYGMSPDDTALGMVLCTLAAAPVMYLAATMAIIQENEVAELLNTALPQARVIFGVFCLAGLAWVLITYAWALGPMSRLGQTKKTMHVVVLMLVLSTFLAPLSGFACLAEIEIFGAMSSNMTDSKIDSLIAPSLPFMAYLHYASASGLRLWTTIMLMLDMWAYALGDNPLDRYARVATLMKAIIPATWVAILAFAGGLLAAAMLDDTKGFDCHRGFFDGTVVNALFVGLMGLSVIANIVAIIVLTRQFGASKNEALEWEANSPRGDGDKKPSKAKVYARPAQEGAEEDAAATEATVTVDAKPKPKPSQPSRRESRSLADYQKELGQLGIYRRYIVGVFGTLSAIMGTISLSWGSFQTANGNEVVVEQASVILLDELLFYTQGIVMFAAFGVDADVIGPLVDKCKQCLASCYCNCPKLGASAFDQYDLIEAAGLQQAAFENSQATCEEFVSGKGDANLVKQFHDFENEDSEAPITGNDVTKWLMQVWKKKCPDVASTMEVCNALVVGGVLRHKNYNESFLDSTFSIPSLEVLQHLAGSRFKRLAGKLSPEDLAEELSSRMVADGLPATRTWMLRKFEDVMVGKEMVDWMLANKECRSRGEAVKLFQNQVDAGYLRHPLGLGFKDAVLFFRWTKRQNMSASQRNLRQYVTADDELTEEQYEQMTQELLQENVIDQNELTVLNKRRETRLAMPDVRIIAGSPSAGSSGGDVDPTESKENPPGPPPV